MKNKGLKTLKILLWTLGGFLGVVLVFLLFAVILTIIPANSSFKEANEGIDIYLASNGLHVDFVLPVKNEVVDWRTYFHPEDFDSGPKPFIAIGRGDKGFYLETPTWDDLKVSNVTNALFWPSPTILHITYLRGRPIQNDHVKKLTLTKEEYQNLVNYIEESIVYEENGKTAIVPCCDYPGVNDKFYYSKGKYHLFMTCNDWVNAGLKQIGVKTATWAPLDKCLLYHF